MKPTSTIGLDLSYTRSGLVYVQTVPNGYAYDSKALSFPAGPKRLARAYFALSKAICAFERPALAVIEDGFFAGSQKVTRMLRELNGVGKLILERLDIPWIEISSTKVKKWIAGRGDAEKYQVAEALNRKYGIRFDDDPGYDLSDAAALAMYGLEDGK